MNGKSSARAAIEGMPVERQLHFVLQPFVQFRLESWAGESERPLLENRYSPHKDLELGNQVSLCCWAYRVDLWHILRHRTEPQCSGG
jgi:hypothetical protein